MPTSRYDKRPQDHLESTAHNKNLEKRNLGERPTIKGHELHHIALDSVAVVLVEEDLILASALDLDKYQVRPMPEMLGIACRLGRGSLLPRMTNRYCSR